jgi:hypothetical protein
MDMKAALCGCILLGLSLGVRAQDFNEDVYGSQIDPTHTATPAAATPYEGEKKVFGSRDQRERVVNAPDKPVQIKKLKFGGDQTETTGAFKQSFFDKEVGNVREVKRDADAKKKQSDQMQTTESASPSPKPKAIESPSPTPAETPSPSPRASASAQDRQQRP